MYVFLIKQLPIKRLNPNDRLSIHRYRVAFLMLTLTTATLWFWIWDGYWQWQHSGSFPSNDLQDSFYESQAEDESLASVDSHVDLSIGPLVPYPAGSSDITADLQLHYSAVVEHLFPASATDSWMVPNRKALLSLLACLNQNACRPNQEKSTL